MGRYFVKKCRNKFQKSLIKSLGNTRNQRENNMKKMIKYTLKKNHRIEIYDPRMDISLKLMKNQ